MTSTIVQVNICDESKKLLVTRMIPIINFHHSLPLQKLASENYTVIPIEKVEPFPIITSLKKQIHNWLKTPVVTLQEHYYFQNNKSIPVTRYGFEKCLDWLSIMGDNEVIIPTTTIGNKLFISV
jgi:hypothetical protein